MAAVYDRAIDELMRAVAARQHALVDRDGLRAAKVDRHAVQRRLSSPDWEPVTARVMRLAGAPVTDEQRAMAAVLDAGRGAVLSHRSAAALWGLPGFSISPLQLSRPRERRSRPTSLAKVHHPGDLPAHHCTHRRLIPVTTLARTVGDLISTERIGRAERAMQSALRLGLGWDSLDEVASALHRPGRAGAVSARILLDRHRAKPVTGSGLECRFLQILRDAGLPEPRRQVDVGGAAWVGRVDFLYDDAKLVVEIDGGWWHDGPLDAERDRRRNAELVSSGFTVLPVAERLILDAPAEVARLVRAARTLSPRGLGHRTVSVTAAPGAGQRRAATTL